MKAPRLKRDWYGRTIELIEKAESSIATLPAGTRLTITTRSTKTRGCMYAEAAPCGHCGVRLRVLIRRDEVGSAFRFVPLPTEAAA